MAANKSWEFFKPAFTNPVQPRATDKTPLQQYAAEWKELPEPVRTQIRDGIINETYTYSA